MFWKPALRTVSSSNSRVCLNLSSARRIRVHISESNLGIIIQMMMKCVRSGDQSVSEEFVGVLYEINPVWYEQRAAPGRSTLLPYSAQRGGFKVAWAGVEVISITPAIFISKQAGPSRYLIFIPDIWIRLIRLTHRRLRRVEYIHSPILLGSKAPRSNNRLYSMQIKSKAVSTSALSSGELSLQPRCNLLTGIRGNTKH